MRMVKAKTTHKYLFKLPVNFYNNSASYYQITPLPNSDIVVGYFFAGISTSPLPSTPPIVYFFLELDKKLDRENQFMNLQRWLNLVYLETGLPTYYQEIPIPENSSFESVFNEFSADNYHNPDISFHGTATNPGHIGRAVYCAKMWSALDDESFEKFDNALNTYIWALEITQLPNPDLKYTLYMTLFLSSINQLASNPEFCKLHPVCTECKKELMHQTKGEKQAIEELMKELLTGEALEEGVKKFKRLYSKLRSEFLHSGKLSGGEKVGGFLSHFEDSANLMTDEMELVITCRQLLEQFLVVKSKKRKYHENS